MSKSKTGEHKFTAKEVEQDCPASLKKLAKEITDYTKQAEQYEEEAQEIQTKSRNNWAEVGKRLWEAKQLCSKEGFAAFRKLYCQVNKSRLSELLKIGQGTRTVAETRTATAARVTKHRANKAEAASVTAPPVTEAKAEHPAQSLTVIDTAMHDFNSLVSRLLQIAAQQPERFAKTTLSAEALAKLGAWLAKVKPLPAAELKEVA